MFVLSYFVGTLNSSVNSVVYGIFSKKYREVFFEHFCCKKPIQAVSLSIVTTNYWSEELSWIEFRQEHLKDFLLKLMKYKLHITYINIVFLLKVIYIGIRYRNTVLHCLFQQGSNLSFIIDTLIYEALYIYKLVPLFVENIWKQTKIHISSVGKVVLRFEYPT